MRKQEKYITIKLRGKRVVGGTGLLVTWQLAGRLGGCQKGAYCYCHCYYLGRQGIFGAPREIFMTHPQGPGGEIAVYSVRRQGQSNVVSGATPRSKLV